MATPLVRLSPETHALLRKMAADSQESMQVLVGRAVEHYRRERLLEDVNRAYARTLGDPLERQQIGEEREVWDQTLADGLEAEHPIGRRPGRGRRRRPEK
ncbi:MAG: toxin-antitoxin system protein [Nitrospirae bacterium]|nr:toxin-antitoxin system protein [Nitrospirota bacterium]